MVKKDFFWGASTSAFQVEGGFGKGGKGIATTDVRHVPEGIADSKNASDHYHHLSEDIELMADLGSIFIVFRSIGHVSWVMVISRIKKASIL